jgi:peroxiredoxin
MGRKKTMDYMKTKICLAIAALLLLGACGKSNRVSIRGAFSGVPETPVYLDLISTGNISTVDSTTTDSKGNFRFRAELRQSQPTFYNIRCQGETITLLLAPGDRVNIRSLGNLAANYLLEGSESSEEIHELNRLLLDSRRTLDSLSDLVTRLPASVERNAAWEEYAREYIRQKRSIIAFVVQHATSLSSIYALYQQMPNGDPIFGGEADVPYYRLVADSLSRRYPTSPHVLSLQTDLDEMERRIELNRMIDRATVEEHSFPDIDMPDMFGQRIRLSSLLGKVILLDFWTANTAENRIQNAELAELYADYKDRGFEIYQVSLDSNRATWVTAVQEQKLPWISVSDLSGLNSPAVRVYNVTSLPANVLIDRQGEIIGRNIPTSRLDAEVRKLL